MNDFDQRKALCELFGWEPCVPPSTLVGWTHRDGTRILSDPLDDLNCIHEAENRLPSFKVHEMNEALYCYVVPADLSVFRANARHRTEALLRVMGKWNSPTPTTPPFRE